MSSGNKGKPKGSLKPERSDKPSSGTADKPSDKAALKTDQATAKASKASDRTEQTAASKTSVEAARAALAETELSSEKAAAAAASRRKQDAKAAFYIPADHPWNQAWKIFAAVAMIGIAMSAFAWTTDPKRFAFSYLTAFAWGITLALGGMFFVILQHITRSGWSVVIRRAAEHLMMSLPIFALLFIPIWFFRESLYPWAVHGGEHSHAIEAKRAFLNVPFWTVRAVIYFAIWSFVAYRLSSLSRQQDESGDPNLTIKMEGFSFPALVLFAFTSSFGVGIDWLMSLEPGWYSTILGVWIFAGATVSMFAFLNVFFARGQAAGLFKQVKQDHFHDLGKLMFGFTIFWAYISFSQYMLMWYANIPEETVFYLHRQQNGWAPVGLFIILGHFFFPFFLVLSRNAKKPAVLTFGGLWVLGMHWVDLYYFVMPMHDHHFHFNPVMDLGPWLLVIGAMFAVVFKRLVSAPLIPLRDPRLDRSLSFENA